MTDEKNFLEQTYTSPTGKTVEIVKIENTALYGLQYSKGGTPPEEFQGMFTTPKHCKEAIDAYFDRVARGLKKKEDEYVVPENEVIGEVRITHEEAKQQVKAKKTA